MVDRSERRALEEGSTRAGVVAVSDQVDARTSHLRRGWYWGSRSFSEIMLKQWQGDRRELHNKSQGVRGMPQ